MVYGRVEDSEDGDEVVPARHGRAGQHDEQVAVPQAEAVGEGAGPYRRQSHSARLGPGRGTEVAPRAEVAAGVRAGGQAGVEVGDDVPPADGHEVAGRRQPVAEARPDDGDAGARAVVGQRDDDLGAGAGLVVLGGPELLAVAALVHGDGRVEAGQPAPVASAGVGVERVAGEAGPGRGPVDGQGRTWPRTRRRSRSPSRLRVGIGGEHEPVGLAVRRAVAGGQLGEGLDVVAEEGGPVEEGGGVALELLAVGRPACPG